MVTQPVRRKASIKDVASAAGVSLGTVSNVLNRPDRVSAKTRERVEKAMEELGFIRNESARQLRAGHSHTLAYVMLDVANPFFTDVAQGIEDVAHERDLSVLLCASHHDPEREQRHLHQLQQQRVHGILITPVDPTSPTLDEIARTTPLVIVDRTRDDESFSSAAADDVEGGRLAVEHLIDLGHTSIAYIGGPHTIGQIRDRYDGAHKAYEEAGLDDDTLVEIETPTLGFADGRAAGERLAGMPRKRRPTAAFCANDLVALGLLQHAMLTGWRVPEDLAIVGFDDIDFAAAAVVPLTSVRQPRAALGRAATELLLDTAADPDQRSRRLSFTPELVARASTGM